MKTQTGIKKLLLGAALISMSFLMTACPDKGGNNRVVGVGPGVVVDGGGITSCAGCSVGTNLLGDVLGEINYSYMRAELGLQLTHDPTNNQDPQNTQISNGQLAYANGYLNITHQSDTYCSIPLGLYDVVTEVPGRVVSGISSAYAISPELTLLATLGGTHFKIRFNFRSNLNYGPLSPERISQINQVQYGKYMHGWLTIQSVEGFSCIAGSDYGVEKPYL